MLGITWIYFVEKGVRGFRAYRDEFTVTALDEGCEIFDMSNFRTYRATRGTRGKDNLPQGPSLMHSKAMAVELLSAIISNREEE